MCLMAIVHTGPMCSSKLKMNAQAPNANLDWTKAVTLSLNKQVYSQADTADLAFNEAKEAQLYNFHTFPSLLLDH